MDIIKRTERKLDDDDIKMLFDTADENKDGKVSIGELMLFLRRCGLDVS